MGVINNPIAWGQFRLLGGWRNLLITGSVYALLLAGSMFGFARGVRAPASNVYSAFVGLFFALQVLALLIYGTARVGGAVRADVRSRLIESHRLMPTSAGGAVLGYLFGAPIQAMGVFAINLGLGAAAVRGAGLPVQNWLFSNAVLLAFAVWLWTIVLFFSFRSAWAMWAGVVLVILFSMSGGELIKFLPGTAVLLSPIRGHTIFDMRAGAAMDWPWVAAVMFQFLIGMLYLFASTRRYLHDEAIGFDPFRGLALLALWAIVSILGIRWWDEFLTRMAFRDWLDGPSAFITTYASLLLLALLPVSSAVRTARAERRGGLLLPVIVVLAAAIVMAICMALYSKRDPSFSMRVVRTAIATVAFLATMRYVLGIAYRLGWKPRLIAFVWLLLAWCLPLMAELAWEAAVAPPDGSPVPTSQIARCSPMGEVYQAWTRPDVHSDGFVGLAFQCALAVFVGLIYHAMHRRRTTPADAALNAPLTLPPVLPGVPAAPTPAVPE